MIVEIHESVDTLAPFPKRGASRKTHRTAQIKPETRHAIMDALASAADAIAELEALRLYAVTELKGILQMARSDHATLAVLRQEIAALRANAARGWDCAKSLEKVMPGVFVAGLALGGLIGWCLR